MNLWAIDDKQQQQQRNIHVHKCMHEQIGADDSCQGAISDNTDDDTATTTKMTTNELERARALQWTEERKKKTNKKL